MPAPRPARRSVLILHGIGTPTRQLEPGEARFWMSTGMFRDVLDRVAEMGRDGPEITFDDGNASDVEIALPELEARGLFATFFLLAGRLDQPGALASGDVRRLARAGMTIGLHGWAHTDWRRLDAGGRQQEFRDARARLADLAGGPVDLAAAPFGLYDRRVIAWLKQDGFSALHTSDRGLAEEGSFLRPRNCLEGDMNTESLGRALRGEVPFMRRVRRVAGLGRKRILPMRVRR